MANKRSTAVDCISHLDDDILVNILSRLPIRDAVRSSILSKRWRNLWTRTPCLDLDMSGFRYNQTGFTYSKTIRFLVDMMSILLRHETATVDKFSLCIEGSTCKAEIYSAVNQLMRFAVRKQVKELLLDLSLKRTCSYDDVLSDWYSDGDEQDDVHFDPPSCQLYARLLSGGPLRVLSFKDCNLDPSGVGFPCLESLSLNRVCMTVPELQHLISACTNLNNLRLIGYRPNHGGNLQIPCPQLKNLALINCHGLRTIEIKVQTLQSFEYEGDLKEDFQLNPGSPLDVTRSHLLIENRIYDEADHWQDKFSEFVSRFHLSSVLTLECFKIEDLALKTEARPGIFSNLKKLEVNGRLCSSNAIFVLVNLLNSAWNLECLSISMALVNHRQYFQHTGEEVDEEVLLELQKTQVECLRHHLRRVNITNFTANKYECTLVKHLLANALALKEMTVEGVEACFQQHLRIRDMLLSWRVNPCTSIIYR